MDRISTSWAFGANPVAVTEGRLEAEHAAIGGGANDRAGGLCACGERHDVGGHCGGGAA